MGVRLKTEEEGMFCACIEILSMVSRSAYA